MRRNAVPPISRGRGDKRPLKAREYGNVRQNSRKRKSQSTKPLRRSCVFGGMRGPFAIFTHKDGLEWPQTFEGCNPLYIGC